MSFWDEPTTILDPITGAPLMGRQTLTASSIKRTSSFPSTRSVMGNLTSNAKSFEEIQLAVGPAYGPSASDSVRLATAGGAPGMQPVQPFQHTTAARPTGMADGAMIWDTSLNKPVFRRAASATGWCDATGADV